MDDDWLYEGIGDYGNWFPTDLDLSQWGELPQITGLDPADFLGQLDGMTFDDWAQLAGPGNLQWLTQLLGGATGGAQEPATPGGGGGGGNGWSNFLRLLGGGGGGGGGGGLLDSLGGLTGLLGLAGTIYGGINRSNATQEGQERMDRAVTEANDTVRGILGGAGDSFKPYQEAGSSALARLSALPPSNLAGQFGAIGQPSNLAGGVRPVGQQSNLAARFRPLGSGRWGA